MLVCVKVDAAESDAPVGVHHRYADVKRNEAQAVVPNERVEEF